MPDRIRFPPETVVLAMVGRVALAVVTRRRPPIVIPARFQRKPKPGLAGMMLENAPV
jgi:hypothetical protein